MVASIFIIFKMILSLKTPKMSVLLRGGSFLLTTTTDKTTITIMIFTPYYQVFCISQLIVLPFAASSLITSPGLKNFTIFSKKVFDFSRSYHQPKNSR
jgi:hypothetical protein